MKREKDMLKQIRTVSSESLGRERERERKVGGEIKRARELK